MLSDTAAMQSLDVSGWGNMTQDSSEVLQAVAGVTHLTALSAEALVRSIVLDQITMPHQPNQAVTSLAFWPLLPDSLGPLTSLTSDAPHSSLSLPL